MLTSQKADTTWFLLQIQWKSRFVLLLGYKRVTALLDYLIKKSQVHTEVYNNFKEKTNGPIMWSQQYSIVFDKQGPKELDMSTLDRHSYCES